MRRAAMAIGAAACLAFLCGRAALAQPRAHVTCYTAYDQDYLYVAAVVDKPTLQASAVGPFSDPLRDDCIAVFVDAAQGTPAAARGLQSTQMVVGAAGGAQLYRGAKAAPLQSFADFLAASDGSRIPFKYGVSRREEPANGLRRYTVEMAIPWLEVGGPPQTGQRYRFNVVAYSAASDSAALLSMSPAVAKPDDVQNPSLWGEIAFVDAPTKAIASAPQARVCARVLAAKPTVDGAVNDAEWNALTSFGFGAAGGAAATAGASAAPRVRIAYPLKPASAPIVPAATEPAAAMPAHVAQTWPHLTMALYHFDVQADPRKPFAVRSPRNPDGSLASYGCPLDGAGPWMTYDSVDWHRGQLEQMRLAGVDVALLVYRGGAADKARYAQRGLTVLSGALRSLRAGGRPYPMVALYLHTASLADAQGGKPNLTTPEGRARLYAAIRDFYLQVPRPFRLAVPLSEANAGGAANVAVLSSAAGFAAVDAEAIRYCRARYAAEFGSDLLILGGSDFPQDAGLDCVLPPLRGESGAASSGLLKAVTISLAGCADDPSLPASARVRTGSAYRAAWKRVAAASADWVVVDAWNDWETGAAIAPSFLAGVENADTTRAFSRMTVSPDRYRAAFLTHTVPAGVAAGSSVQVTLRVLNTGVAPWTPEAVALAYRWKPKGGAEAAAVRVPLGSLTPPGQVAAETTQIAAPTQPGQYELVAGLAETTKKGDLGAYFGAQGTAALVVPVTVLAPADGARSGAMLLGTDLPCTAEAGGAYTASVVLRNDGPRPWPRGTVVTGRLWRFVSAINATGEPEGAAPVAEMADASAALAVDVAPGQSTTVRVPVVFATADGAALPASSPTDAWTYSLRWEVRTQDGIAVLTDGEPVALTEVDPGAVIVSEYAPNQLPGEKRQPVRLVLRNAGPATWKREGVRVGYHWYYQDGSEVVWEDETTAIPRDCVPGDEPIDMLAWVTAPPYDGRYFLVFDTKIGDTWSSTLPSCRASDTRVRTVDVVSGRLAFVDLTAGCNLDGVAAGDGRGDGDFDGAGHTLPAELMPPYAIGEVSPATLWMPAAGTGLDSSRRLSFRCGSKVDKEKNMLVPTGQKVSVPAGKEVRTASFIHILAFAVKPDVSASCTLQFANGAEQYMQFPVSQWNAAPRFGEPIAYATAYTYQRGSDGLGPGASVYRYTLKVGDKRQLAAIQFGNSPDVRILAITLER